MANFIVSYDLNGNVPSHAQMDEHMAKAGYTRGRILETVWYVQANQALQTVTNYIDMLLTSNDRLIVVEAKDASARNLLIPNDEISKFWNS